MFIDKGPITGMGTCLIYGKTCHASTETSSSGGFQAPLDVLEWRRPLPLPLMLTTMLHLANRHY